MARKLKYLAAQPDRAHGFTLVEMLIAITLGMLLVIGVSYAYLGTKQTSRMQASLARMQEGARFAFETMALDIRMAGSTGCSVINTPINLYGTADWFADLFFQPLVGYENASATAPTTPQNIRANVSTLSGHSASDALAVVLAEGGGGVIMGGNREYRVMAFTSPNIFTVTPAPTALSSGELVVATDCQTALLGVATVAGNVITIAGATTAYGPGSRVFGVTGNLFYIGVNAAGEPTLYRQHLTQAGGAPSTVSQELVEGVEDMQIMYGVDTTPTADHIVDTYLNANDVEGAGVPGATPKEKWQRVLSIKVNLLMRSTEDGIISAPQDYHYPDPDSAATTPADRRLRRAFTSTIAVRNRL